MAFTGINKGTDYFNTLLYSGDGNTGRNLTGVGFEPSWVWIKERTSTSDHMLFDQPRGVEKYISSNLTTAEQTSNQMLTAFDSDGFTIGPSNDLNDPGQTYVGWNWKANGAGSSNTDGDITSTVSADTTSGFSIIKFTGNSSTSQSFGHGLSGTPKMWFIKNITDSGDNWQVYFNNDTRLKLDTTEAGESNYLMTANATTITTPSSSGGAWGNSNGKDFIVYAFQEIQGFSKISTFVGNGSSNGPFLYCGFKPAFIILKNSSDGAKNWEMLDNKRPSSGQNPADDILFPDTSDAESASQTDRLVDFVSNGVKIRGNSAQMNGSGNTFIYMVFGEAPIVGTNDIPANAK